MNCNYELGCLVSSYPYLHFKGLLHSNPGSMLNSARGARGPVTSLSAMAVPKGSAKAKAKAKASGSGLRRAEPKNLDPKDEDADDENGKKKKRGKTKADPLVAQRLQELELKKGVLLTEEKWGERIKVLNKEVSESVAAAEQFDQTSGYPGKNNDYI